MKLKNEIGIALREARLARGLAQDEMSANQAHISRLESGAKIPSIQRVEEIAEILGFHPVTLFTLAYIESQADQLLLASQVAAELREILLLE